MIRRFVILAVAIPLMGASPSAAQDHSMHGMPGMTMPEQPQKKPAPAKPNPPSGANAMPNMDHATMPGMTPETGAKPAAPMNHDSMPGMNHPDAHAGHDVSTMHTMELTGTALPAGNAPAPPPPHDYYADRQFPGAEMAKAREAMMKEQGGLAYGQALLNIFEYQVHDGHDGYRWDGEAFYGGDINRLWIKSEGEGELRRNIDSAEVQLLYSRAIDPFFNLQAGIRQDFGPSPKRSYATLGFEGLAPGFFKLEGAVFLSTKGDVLARMEGYYDQPITQRLILQPRIELNLSAQDVPENGIGAGLTNAELGARLRYEFSRRFAPYIGVSYSRKTAASARFARMSGEDVETTSFVAGIRFWF